MARRVQVLKPIEILCESIIFHQLVSIPEETNLAGYESCGKFTGLLLYCFKAICILTLGMYELSEPQRKRPCEKFLTEISEYY